MRPDMLKQQVHRYLTRQAVIPARWWGWYVAVVAIWYMAEGIPGEGWLWVPRVALLAITIMVLFIPVQLLLMEKEDRADLETQIGRDRPYTIFGRRVMGHMRNRDPVTIWRTGPGVYRVARDNSETLTVGKNIDW